MHRTNQPTRRDLFDWGICGLGATALAAILGGEASASDRTVSPIAPRAKRAIHICLVGGLSHVDSFDYKPEL